MQGYIYTEKNHNQLTNRDMTAEQKAAMDEGYDMIVELMEFIRDNEFTQPKASAEAREILNNARGALDLINDELYKTL